MTIFVGADPEVFFETNKGLMSIIGKLGGSKASPMPIGNGCAVQEDNVAAEFNIPPCSNADDFVKYIQYNLDYLNAKAKEYGARLSLKASGEFSKEELKDKRSWVFGCEPDYDAWKLDVNPKPKAPSRYLRSAGGHVHLACTEDPIQVVRAMDLFIGAQLTAVDPDKQRRMLYGKAGAFRPKDYGVEYRTPSNYWVTRRDLTEWIFHQCEKVVEFVKGGNTLDENSKMGVMIQDCINNSDVSLLKEINKHYGLQAIN